MKRAFSRKGSILPACSVNTAGRVENSQIGAFLCYAGPSGSAFIDRELYLPKTWTQDGERCRQAGIPDRVGFSSKPELARQMLERALDKNIPAGWVTGDSVYGGNRGLRLWLEEREQPFVLAVPCNEPLWWQGPRYSRANEIADAQLPDAWHRLSAGSGSKRERWYDWALIPLWRRLQLPEEERRWGHYLLIHQSCGDPADRVFYVAFSPRAQASLETLVSVTGQRWHIEQGFQAANGECGLDQYEIRRWAGRYRHITLVLLAHALLAVMRQAAQQKKHLTNESA
nr:IS701 family transposase [Halomonas zhuhanensis]